MMLSMQLLKSLHVFGMAMTIGGFLTSYIITKRYQGDEGADQGAFVASHLVAAPGLVLVILTGFVQSFFHRFAEFKGAGYMHAKLLLVVLTVVFLAMDIRAQGVLRRSIGKGNNDAVREQCVKTRTLAGGLGLLALVLIVLLIEIRPF